MTDAEDAARQQAQIQRVLHESGRVGDEPLQLDPRPDRVRTFRGVNLSRMRRSWRPDDYVIMQEISAQAERWLQTRFLAAFDIMDRIFSVVRTPRIGSDDKPLLDASKRPVWEVNDLGMPKEDWSALGDRDRLGFLYEITTHLFEWEQSEADQWGLAMYAKGVWEESFALGFTAPAGGKVTVESSSQAGHLASMEDRYFAIFQAVLSRRAEALVRSMTRIEQRLKDTAQL